MNTSKTIARFRIAGTVTSIKEFVSVASGKKSLQVIISDGSNALRADVYDEALYHETARRSAGFNAIITGRIVGKVNDRGYFNYTLFADEIMAGYAQSPHTSTPTTPQQPAPAPAPSTMADEDIPF